MILRRAWYPSLHHRFGNSHLLVVCGETRMDAKRESGGNEKSAPKQRLYCVSQDYLEGNGKVVLGCVKISTPEDNSYFCLA